MNLHSLAFLTAFVVLARLTFRRSSWGIALYLLTFYASPTDAWWGQGLNATIGERWCLIASLILLAGVFYDRRLKSRRMDLPSRRLLAIMVAYAINATVVHLALASNPDRSGFWLGYVWKQVLLLYLLLRVIQDEFDLKVLLYSIIVGSAFIGVEVVFMGAGHFHEGRLEWTLGAGDSNYVGALMCMAICLCGSIVLFGSRREKVGAAVSAVLCTIVMLRNASRGSYLAALAAGLYLLIVARRRARPYALSGIALVALVLMVVMNAEHREAMSARFMTIFAPEEQREASSESRVQYWRLAVELIEDHPLGAGGEAAFMSPLGLTYLARIGVLVNRSVHNGYLDIAAGWGIQGLSLYLAAIGMSWWQVRKAIKAAHRSGRESLAFQGNCIEMALVTQLVAAIFLSYLRGEWFYWLMAMFLGYSRVVGDIVDADKDREIEQYVE